FDCSGLPQDALIVDVGGRIGTVARKVLKNHPYVRVVVQDMPKVIEAADKLWTVHSPEALGSGRVVLQGMRLPTAVHQR
ncbi:hypothetical protein BDZ89DRAFT_962349, partial [Hymenopellis radicata]